MSLETKNRQTQTAELCKQHLRQKYPDKLGLVEELIVEIEGPPQNCDLTGWGGSLTSKASKKRCSSASRFNSRTGSIIVVVPAWCVLTNARSYSKGPSKAFSSSWLTVEYERPTANT